ncbi:GerW family sporulation protein [Mediterraneibacter agrestimuris]|uniref:GerW family sporulation protein n=1 Tax=Mediterraneibacter agrestimuris TaxID=2941333 RepID=UPI0020426009|nr:GerW family sporulation protein [Mediterraneibacter agrestimuris]
MSDNNIRNTVESLLSGMDGLISSKTVVGDAIQVKDTTIIPLVDVSFGIGAGSALGDKKGKGMGGMSGKVTPSSVLVIKDGAVRLVNIKNQDTITKILDMAPEILDRFTTRKEDKMTEEDVADILDEA